MRNLEMRKFPRMATLSGPSLLTRGQVCLPLQGKEAPAKKSPVKGVNEKSEK